MHCIYLPGGTLSPASVRTPKSRSRRLFTDDYTETFLFARCEEPSQVRTHWRSSTARLFSASILLPEDRFFQQKTRACCWVAVFLKFITTLTFEIFQTFCHEFTVVRRWQNNKHVSWTIVINKPREQVGTRIVNCSYVADILSFVAHESVPCLVFCDYLYNICYITYTSL